MHPPLFEHELFAVMVCFKTSCCTSFNSRKLSQESQLGHFPSHLLDCSPQCWHSNSGIDLTNKTLEQIEDIFQEFSVNKMQWVIKFGSVELYRTEYDRIRATIRRIKHQEEKGESFNNYATRVRDGMRDRNREKIS